MIREERLRRAADIVAWVVMGAIRSGDEMALVAYEARPCQPALRGHRLLRVRPHCSGRLQSRCNPIRPNCQPHAAWPQGRGRKAEQLADLVTACDAHAALLARFRQLPPSVQRYVAGLSPPADDEAALASMEAAMADPELAASLELARPSDVDNPSGFSAISRLSRGAASGQHAVMRGGLSDFLSLGN